MKPYPYLPGVPAAGHISRGFWHPGKPDGCPKCEPPGRFARCKNGERVSQCYHVPRCENIPGHGFGRIEPEGDQA